MDDLIEKVQHILDNPIKQIEWEKISQEFSQLLEQDIEYDDEEIQYIQRKLSLPEGEMTIIFVIADELLSNYKFDKGLKSQAVEFEKDNKEIVNFLKTLKFPRVNNRVLSYETDHWFLMDGFEKLLQKGIQYHMDDIRNWLSFNKTHSLLEDNVIEEIARIAEYAQLRFRKPNFTS